MLRIFLPLIFSVALGSDYDAARWQLEEFKNETEGPIGILTTGTGVPVEYTDTSALNKRLLGNEYLMEAYQQTARKNIPERVVHAAGTGALGYFETTNDITHLTKAKLFSEIGKQTPVLLRISTGVSSTGGRETNRESRGFAVKFYTEEGNFDLAGVNNPVFVFKDPALFPGVVTAFRKNPATNLVDNNMPWDFVTQRPESFNRIVRQFSYQGTPYSYANLLTFCVHTYQLRNATGHLHYGRFSWWPTAGTKYFNLTEARALTTEGDNNYYSRDFYNKIASGDPVSYQLKLQVISEDEVKNNALKVFDVTRELPIDEYPTTDIGTMYINKNPSNFFAQLEQAAYCPGNVVPGVDGAPDSLFLGRTFAYTDTQMYRLGANFKKIDVNRPMYSEALTYMRDGVAPLGDNGGSGPNYYPNSFNGPIPCVDEYRAALIDVPECAEPNNYDQVSNFYESLTSVEQGELVDALATHLSPCVDDLKNKVVEILSEMNTDFADAVSEFLANHES